MTIRTAFQTMICLSILASVCASASLREPVDLGTASASAPQGGSAIAPEPAMSFRTLQDQDIGCCVIPGSPGNKCGTSNRAFCRSRAEQAHLSFEFHANTACSAVAACR
jgi:hypothetical protein